MDNFSFYQILNAAPDSGKIICACGFNLHGGLSASLSLDGCMQQSVLPQVIRIVLLSGVSYKTVFVAACENVWVPSLLS